VGGRWARIVAQALAREPSERTASPAMLAEQIEAELKALEITDPSADIAAYFGVTVDELLGYKPADTLADVYLKIKSLFESLPGEEAFQTAYRLSFLLHEAACTKGYKSYVPWDTDKNRGLEPELYKWGFSACSEPEGITVHCGNAIFISNGTLHNPLTVSQMRDIYLSLERLCDRNVLRVLFTLYDMTCRDFDLYVSLESIAKQCKLPENDVVAALDNFPVTAKDIDGGTLYRIEGSFMHVPPLLMMLRER
jgi:hypothetical protein